MKKIIALQQYTDKYVSFYQGQIRNIEDGLADKLIEEGIVAEHGDSNSNKGIIIIDISGFQLGEKINKTWQEIYNLVNTGNIVIFYRKTQSSSPIIINVIQYYIVGAVSHTDARTQEGENEYTVQCIQNTQSTTTIPLTFTANSADDYIKIKN